MSRHRDIYREVTAHVLAALDRGTVPWRRPWRDNGLQRNLQTGRLYRGANQLLLQLVQDARGFEMPFWTTYRAAQKSGGHVRKGEHGSMVIFWRIVEREDRERPGETVAIPLGRAYTVFNVAQTEDLEPPPIETSEVEPLVGCERIVREMPDPPTIRLGGNSAYYAPALDLVQVPPMAAFPAVEPFYATLFHELGHATGHDRRLARDAGGHRFGSPDYSREELVAELTAAMLCGVAGISPATLETSAAYIDNWRQALRADAGMVVSAAGGAQRAADFILGVDLCAD